MLQYPLRVQIDDETVDFTVDTMEGLARNKRDRELVQRFQALEEEISALKGELEAEPLQKRLKIATTCAGCGNVIIKKEGLQCKHCDYDFCVTCVKDKPFKQGICYGCFEDGSCDICGTFQEEHHFESCFNCDRDCCKNCILVQNKKAIYGRILICNRCLEGEGYFQKK